jgi:hypothetical protein
MPTYTRCWGYNNLSRTVILNTTLEAEFDPVSQEFAVPLLHRCAIPKVLGYVQCTLIPPVKQLSTKAACPYLVVVLRLRFLLDDNIRSNLHPMEYLQMLRETVLADECALFC